MQLLSTSEYELGFIAIGSAPVGVIAIGGVPVGVIGGGHAYRLACALDRVAASEDDDDVTPELPGLVFDTLESPGRARVQAHGPPPMNIELEVTSPSEVIDSHPLLLPGARIEAPAGDHDAERGWVAPFMLEHRDAYGTRRMRVTLGELVTVEHAPRASFTTRDVVVTDEG